MAIDSPALKTRRAAPRDWIPQWSSTAALRAVRATLVVPVLFAFSIAVLGDLQVATYAAFGGFATLVMASFGGDRRDKLRAHFGLAVTGSVLLVIGTAASASLPLAAVVTLVVTFLVLFGGVAGPNAAAGGVAALLAYVLPAASPGTMSMVPARLGGWWLASVVGTAAVLLLSPRSPATALRDAASRAAGALADHLDAALRDGADVATAHEAAVEAKHRLIDEFTATPYRPTGLAAEDQALDTLVGLLEWCASVIADTTSEYPDLSGAPEVERELLAGTSAGLREVSRLVAGQPSSFDAGELDRRIQASVERLRALGSGDPGYVEAVHLSFHARTGAFAVREAVTEARAAVPGGRPARRLSMASLARVASPHTSLRSVWFVNSLRGAVALTAAVVVAGASGVEHRFWVVLGTLSVLRGNAAATGSTALRALLGTALGVVVGAVLLLVIGTSAPALWIALPIAVLVAGYAPGALPFTAGQAAFTVTVSVLFNLLAPAGWQIGVVRIEDVAIGCAVCLVAGALFWPRGARAVVADDLADAFRAGGAYLASAANWALGLRHDPPSPAAATAAGARLDDALRGFLSEQGTKHVPKPDLWRLVMGTVRSRLTAHSLAGLPNPHVDPDPFRRLLGEQAGQLAAWYDHLASRLDRTDHGDVPMLAPPAFPDLLRQPGASVRDLACALWVHEHLKHISARLAELVEPAGVVATQRHRPWWR
ncbi:FUSC family protein [Amycolatopsis sp. CA-128772]|uniref:FUSC family protein n=1 Tax=Amycolatopsis sp. CA-128772 TaxID=2073159 RepID=UPI000CD071C7|nr:FUSC family protein [Amycolatopsis sp. CA-128772]